eukprot:1086492-Rhodomonas_salina.3
MLLRRLELYGDAVARVLLSRAILHEPRGAISLRSCYAKPGTNISYAGAICLRKRYVMPGTDRAYHARRAPRDTSRARGRCGHVIAAHGGASHVIAPPAARAPGIGLR